jgi:hypothetical protein
MKPHDERLFIQNGADANCTLIEAVHLYLDSRLRTNIMPVGCIMGVWKPSSGVSSRSIVDQAPIETSVLKAESTTRTR